MSSKLVLGTSALLLLSSIQATWANTPTFDHVKAPAEEEQSDQGPVWKASAQAGLLMSTGNSSATTLSSAFKSSRHEGNNRFLLDLSGAFARSTIFIASDADGSGSVDASEVQRISRTNSQSWLVKPRYDRFLSERNSLYTSASASADKPAGRDFVGSGQLGYSRILITDEVHTLTVESGYDFSYENLSGGNRARSIHSLRVFAGYEGKLSEDTRLALSSEALFNVNEINTSSGPVAEFADHRLNNKLSLTTSIYGDLSFSFSFLAQYDGAPAPRPPLSVPYVDGYRPPADKLDTRTEAALIINFL